MGAASSVQQLYREAMLWFKKYFDEQMYMEDFNTIDKDSDGTITYKEFQRWIKAKASPDSKGPWNMLIHHQEIIQIAHNQAGKYAKPLDHMPPQKIVDSRNFKMLLVHLFAISTLWVHFKNADEWVDGHDFGNMTLSRDEFHLACRTINGAYSNEKMSEEQMNEDFAALDKNKNESIDFIEVCDYCCQFIEPGYRKILSMQSVAGSNGDLSPLNPPLELLDVQAVEESGESEKNTPLQLTPISKFNTELKSINSLTDTHKFQPLEVKNMVAMEALQENMEKNKEIANFMEVKYNTEREIEGMLQGLEDEGGKEQ